MGYKPNHTCRDDQLYSGLKAVIDRVLHGVQYIWEANSTDEKLIFYLLTRITRLTRPIESKYCGCSAIYGRLEIILFLTAIITTNILYWETGMVRPILSIVVRMWHRETHWIWLTTLLELFHWSDALSWRTLTSRSHGTLTTLDHWVCSITWSNILKC